MNNPGLSWFPLDCQFEDNVKLVTAEYGLKGFAVIVKLWQKIYGVNGYYCEWNDEVGLLFCQEVGEGRKFVSEIITSSIKRGIFSKEMFDKYHILTSAGIQKRYLEASKRRKGISVKEEYLLVDIDHIPENVNIIGKNVYRNSKNVDRNRQMRRDEMIKDKGQSDFQSSLSKGKDKGEGKEVSEPSASTKAKPIKSGYRCRKCGEPLYEGTIHGSHCWFHPNGLKPGAKCSEIYDSVAEIIGRSEYPQDREESVDKYENTEASSLADMMPELKRRLFAGASEGKEEGTDET